MKRLLLFSFLVPFIVNHGIAQCSTTISGTSFCGSGCNGTVVFHSTNGTPPYNLVVTAGPSAVYTSTYTWINACPGSYHYDVTDAASSCHDTGTVTVTAIPITTAPALTIEAYDLLGNPLGNNPTICENQHIDFFVVPPFTNVVPNIFTWKENGLPMMTQSNVSNFLNATFSTTSLATGDIVTLEISWPGTPCMIPNPQVSQSIQFTVIPNQPPSINIISSMPNDTVCYGSSITFTANAADAGTPTYQWYLDGAPVGSSSTYTTISTLAAGNHQMMCCITSSEYCDTVDPVYNPTVCDSLDFYVEICTSVPDKSIDHSIIIHPNPVANQFTIYDVRFTILEIGIFNIVGEKILSQLPEAKNQKQVAVDVSTLPQGIYFVKVRGENGESVAKFIKQ